MTCCTALAPEPPERNSSIECEINAVLSYVEQRDAAWRRVEELEKILEVRDVATQETVRHLQVENASLQKKIDMLTHELNVDALEREQELLEELTQLQEEKRSWRGRMAFLEQIAREKQEENAALRLASQAAASHRQALEQLVRDCLQHMDKPIETIVIIEDEDHLYKTDMWDIERIELVRRFAELTTQEG